MTPRTSLALEALDSRVVPAAGDLDPGFGAGGAVSLQNTPAADLAVQPDGLAVAVGTAGDNMVVTRLTAAGNLDPTFNLVGQQVIDFNGTDIAQAVAVQPDGKIVVVGSTDGPGGSDFAVARLNADGTPDTSFNPGSGGFLVVDFGGTDFANAVFVQADGSILVAGSGGAGNDFAVARLTSTGLLDGNFNGGGIQLIDLGGSESANAVAAQADGRVVLAGTAGSDVGIVRLTSGGLLDATFGTGGAVVVDAGGTADAGNAVVVQPDDGIVVAGGNDFDLVVFRLLPANGDFDPAFGTGGRVVLGFGATTVANAAALQPDGQLVLVGGVGQEAFAARLDTAGALDPTFATGGVARFNYTNSDLATGVGLTPAGRVVVGGTAAADGLVLQLLGSTAVIGNSVAVGGQLGGQAQVFVADPAGGRFFATPAATLGPISGLGGLSLRPAAGDVDGDGTADTVLVTGPGSPLRVAVVSGATGQLLVQPFDPFGGNFTGGGYVSTGDIDGDGRAEFVVTPDEGGGPRVTVFSLRVNGATAVRANFFGIDDANFRGGARSAVGDINADGTPDVVVAAGFGGGPRTAVFRGQSVLGGAPTRLVNDFFAFPGDDAVNLRNGSFVAAGDVTGDGFADLVFGGGPGGAPRVFVLSGAVVSAGNVAGAQATPVANFFVAGDAADRGGVRVGVADADGDGIGDLIAGSGANRPARVRVYAAAGLGGGGGEPAVLQDLAPFGGSFLMDGVYVG